MAKCSWCGQDTNNILCDGELVGSGRVFLALCDDNDIDGLPCVGWFWNEKDFITDSLDNDQPEGVTFFS